MSISKVGTVENFKNTLIAQRSLSPVFIEQEQELFRQGLTGKRLRCVHPRIRHGALEK
jgi:hypothetical protein